jgi:hypothetical protein
MINLKDRFGYYLAAGKKFNSKIKAIMDLPVGNNDIRWWFHDEHFTQFNWQVEPNESLDQLYKQRAQQLRDEYDYLILCYSGGSDSHNILKTFERNNIKLDEINFHGAFSRDVIKEPISTHPSLKNTEIYTVAEPYIKQLQKKWPNLKVDHYDWSESIKNVYLTDKNNDWISATGFARLTPNAPGNRNTHHGYRDPYNTFYKNKKIAYIFGQDKPRIIKHDNSWYIYFIDTLWVNTCDNTNDMESNELFYWHPSCDRMLAKQAHVLKRFFESDPLRMNYFNNITIDNFNVKKYYDLIKPIIYPTTYNVETFQTEKVSPGVYTERDWWFYERDSKAYQVWQDGINSVQASVDPFWLNKGNVRYGVKGSLSKFYKFA